MNEEKINKLKLENETILDANKMQYESLDLLKKNLNEAVKLKEEMYEKVSQVHFGFDILGLTQNVEFNVALSLICFKVTF